MLNLLVPDTDRFLKDLVQIVKTVKVSDRVSGKALGSENVRPYPADSQTAESTIDEHSGLYPMIQPKGCEP